MNKQLPRRPMPTEMLLRYQAGPTALMQVKSVHAGHGGSIARYYGIQCMGGIVSAYHEACTMATAEDREQWKKMERWRRVTEARTRMELGQQLFSDGDVLELLDAIGDAIWAGLRAEGDPGWLL